LWSAHSSGGSEVLGRRRWKLEKIDGNIGKDRKRL
jgi:hypothetical protein